VYGGSGKGKSMIALHVLDVLERAEGEPIWHFYDTQASVAHATGGNMIRSLIYQLLRIYDNLFQYILPELNIQCEALFDDSMFETQWSILDSMLHHPTLPILNCILDGIDECEPTSLEWLLTKIDRLFLWTASGDIFTSRDRYGLMGAMGSPLSEKPRPRLRMLILSRAKSPPCLSILSRYKHLSLDEYWKDCEGGVARLIELSFKQAKVDVRLTGRYELRHALGQLDQYLVKELVNRAEGSYLWVNLNTSTLKDLITKLQSFDDIVESLPAKLEDIYVRMLHGIAPQSTGSQVKAAYVLQWVLAAARPLKVEELATLSRLVHDQDLDDYAEADVQTWVAVCNHFLEIHDDCVVLCHSSVRDFFHQFCTQDKNRLPSTLRVCGKKHKIHETVLDGLYLEHQRAQQDQTNWSQVVSDFNDFLKAASPKADDVATGVNFIPPPRFALVFYYLQYWLVHARLASAKYWVSHCKD
jgi:hypothetical protein